MRSNYPKLIISTRSSHLRLSVHMNAKISETIKDRKLIFLDSCAALLRFIRSRYREATCWVTL